MPAGGWGALEHACPIVASYGANDPTLKGTAAQLSETLERFGVPHDVREYPRVGHGFMNRHDKADTGPLLNLLMRVSNTAYHAEATEDARRRIVAFFDQHLKQAPLTLRPA